MPSIDGVSYANVADVLGTPATGSTAVSRKEDQFGQETFLKLLVAQLRYQDPTSPQDGAEFLSQTAQFASVEKLNQLAELQTELLSAQRLLGASGLIGRTVSFSTPDGGPSTGVVTSALLGTDGPVLRVDDKDVPLAAVTEVSTTTAA